MSLSLEDLFGPAPQAPPAALPEGNPPAHGSLPAGAGPQYSLVSAADIFGSGDAGHRAASGAAGAALSGAAGAQTRADPLVGCGPRVRFAAEAQMPEQQAAARERLAASAAGADGRRAIAVEDGGGSFVSSPALPAQCLPAPLLALLLLHYSTSSVLLGRRGCCAQKQCKKIHTRTPSTTHHSSQLNHSALAAERAATAPAGPV